MSCLLDGISVSPGAHDERVVPRHADRSALDFPADPTLATAVKLLRRTPLAY